jgi:hypothetical protein
VNPLKVDVAIDFPAHSQKGTNPRLPPNVQIVDTAGMTT